jgi:Xaa-Pro dipeptidase
MGAGNRWFTDAASEMTVPFTQAEFRRRHERVRRAMGDAGIDVLHCTSPESIHYLTGYSAEWYQGQPAAPWADWQVTGVSVHRERDGWIHIDQSDESLLTQVTSASSDLRIWHPGDVPIIDFVVQQLDTSGWLPGVVGFEMGSYRPCRRISERLQVAFEGAGCRVVDATELVRLLRREKSPQERAYTRTAARIAEVGMQAAVDHARAGVTELSVWGELTAAMARVGGETPGIPLPVASGTRSGSIHALASRRTLMPGDVVTVDVMGVYHRYHCNLARGLSIGRPNESVRRVAAQIAEIGLIAADMIRPGLTYGALLSAIEDRARAHEIWEDRWWVGGYELGVAFPPDWVGEFIYDADGDNTGKVLTPGDVVNLETNFYLPGVAGVLAIINTFVVDDDHAEFLTPSFPEGLVIIDG